MKNPLWDYIFGAPKEKRTMIELLQSLPPFEGLSTTQTILIDRIIHKRNYKAGEIVFEENVPGAGLYIITSGEVIIEKVLDKDNCMTLATLSDRSFFGELALIDEIPRSARATVSRDAELLAFCKPDLEALRERNPGVATIIVMNIAKLICKRLVKANDNLEELQRKINEHRVIA